MTVTLNTTHNLSLTPAASGTWLGRLGGPSRALCSGVIAIALAAYSDTWVASAMADEGNPEPRLQSLDAELKSLLAVLPGRYTGALANAVNPDREGQIFHTIETIEMPAYGAEVLLHTLSFQGFEDPRPFQQKFYSFDLDEARDRNRMTSVVMMRAPRWTAGAALDETRHIRFPAECAINWHRDGDAFIARVKRGDCVYKSAAFGGEILPDMTYVVTDDSFAISDVLYRPDGSTVSPDNGLTTAQRQGE